MTDLYFTAFDNATAAWAATANDLPQPELHRVSTKSMPEFWDNYLADNDYITKLNSTTLLMTDAEFMRAYAWFEGYCDINNLEDLSLLESYNLMAL